MQNHFCLCTAATPKVLPNWFKCLKHTDQSSRLRHSSFLARPTAWSQSISQHRQYRGRVPPVMGGGVAGAKYACTLMFGKWFCKSKRCFKKNLDRIWWWYLPAVDELPLALSSGNRTVRFFVNCDTLPNVPKFDRLLEGSCPILTLIDFRLRNFLLPTAEFHRR